MLEAVNTAFQRKDLIHTTDKCNQVTVKVIDTFDKRQKLNLLLYGQPGFGRKTCVEYALNALTKSKRDNLCSVHIDGMIHSTEANIIDALIIGLKKVLVFDKDYVIKNSIKLDNLDSIFAKSPNFTGLLLVIDHIEVMSSIKKQYLLYSLLEFVQRTQYPVVFVGITSDLRFQESLEKRVKSRFSHESLYFFDYTEKDLLQILLAKFKSIPDAKEYTSYFKTERFQQFLLKIQTQSISIQTFLEIINIAVAIHVQENKKEGDFNELLSISIEQAYGLFYPNIQNELLKQLNIPEHAIVFALLKLIGQGKPVIYFSNVMDFINQRRQGLNSQHQGSSVQFTHQVYNAALKNLVDLKFIILEKENATNLETNQVVLNMKIDQLLSYQSQNSGEFHPLLENMTGM